MYKCKQVSNFDIGFEELTAFPGGSVKISKYPAALLHVAVDIEPSLESDSFASLSYTLSNRPNNASDVFKISISAQVTVMYSYFVG